MAPPLPCDLDTRPTDHCVACYAHCFTACSNFYLHILHPAFLILLTLGDCLSFSFFFFSFTWKLLPEERMRKFRESNLHIRIFLFKTLGATHTHTMILLFIIFLHLPLVWREAAVIPPSLQIQQQWGHSANKIKRNNFIIHGDSPGNGPIFR